MTKVAALAADAEANRAFRPATNSQKHTKKNKRLCRDSRQSDIMSPCSMHARPPERADHALIEECFNYSRTVMTYARNGPLSDVRRRNSPHSRSSAAGGAPGRGARGQ